MIVARRGAGTEDVTVANTQEIREIEEDIADMREAVGNAIKNLNKIRCRKA